MMRKRCGFTLIELLVVIAIIGVLIAMLLPAIQMARAAAARTQCLNNMKQFGIALQNYHSDHGLFPLGRITLAPNSAILDTDRSQETPWFVSLLPYLEQGNLAEKCNFEIGSVYMVSGIPWGLFANITVGATWVGVFQCPSDTSNAFIPRGDVGDLKLLRQILDNLGMYLTRGNYAASWGNTNFSGINAQNGSNNAATKYLLAPFGDRRIRMKDVIDGVSKSVFLSEIIQGKDYDVRGFAWTPIPGGGMFMSRFTPNGYTDYYNLTTGGDQIPNTASANDPDFCINKPPTLPCYPENNTGLSFAGSRSRHSGGVNVCMGDGSCRFVADSIDGNVWIAVNSIQNDDTIAGKF